MESAHQIVDLLCGLPPIDSPVLFEKLGRLSWRIPVWPSVLLRCGHSGSIRQCIDGFCQQMPPCLEDAVVKDAGGVVVSYGDLCTSQNVASVDLVLEKESGRAGDFLAMDDGPVDRSRSAEVGEEGAMKVDRAHGWGLPHQFREHPEGNDHPKVWRPTLERVQKIRGLQLLRLGQWQSMTQGDFFHLRGLHLASTSRGTVRCCDHPHHLMPRFEQTLQADRGEAGGAKEDDAEGSGGGHGQWWA